MFRLVVAVAVAAAVLACVTDIVDAQSGSGSGAPDPCATALCGANTACAVNAGVAECACLTGFEGNDGLAESVDCTPVDNCLASPCGRNSVCAATGPGTHSCTCAPRFDDVNGNGVDCEFRVRILTQGQNLALRALDVGVETPTQRYSLNQLRADATSNTDDIAVIEATLVAQAGLIATNNKTERTNHAAQGVLIAGLTTRMTAAEGDITSNNAALDGRVQSVVNDLAGYKVATDPRVAKLESDLSMLTTTTGQQATTLQTNINKVASDLTAYQGTNDPLVSRAITDSTNNKASIAKLTPDVAALKATVKSMEDCAKEMRLFDSVTKSCGDWLSGSQLPPPDFATQWTQLLAQAGTGSYKEFIHGLGTLPERVLVVATQIGKSGSTLNGNGFWFEDTGGSMPIDDDVTNEVGGLVSASGAIKIRVWAPDRFNAQSNKFIISNCDGWGGERDCVAAQRDSVYVRVMAWKKLLPGVNPITKSILMRSGSASTQSNADLTGFPVRSSNLWHDVKCYATNTYDGQTNYHRSRGSGIVDNDQHQYGGLVMAYKPSSGAIRMWAPSTSGGRIIAVHDGWGGERNARNIGTSTVRCSVWADGPAPAHDSGWFTLNAQAGDASYRAVPHMLGKYPSKVKVLTRPTSGNNRDYIFEAIGTGNVDDDNTSRQGGGLLFAYNHEMVKLWAPDRNNGNGRFSILFAADGWGTRNTIDLKSAQVRVMVWA